MGISKKRNLVSMLAVLGAVLVLVSYVLVSALAAEEDNIASGDGWYIDNTGCLYITGSVSDWQSNAPWYSNRLQITSVVAKEGASAQTCARMFEDHTNLTSVDLSGLDTSNVTTMTDMFSGCSKLTTVNMPDFNTDNVTTMSSMFYNCSGLTNLNLSGFSTTGVVTMQSMFYGCKALTELTGFVADTSQTTEGVNMSHMFRNCSSLVSLDMSNWDTRNVMNMERMFYGCKDLKELELSNFDTANVTTMASMFSGCSGLTTLDLSPWNTAKVTNMSSMFSGCSGLTTLDLSSLNTAKVTSMLSMFSGCSGLTILDLSSLNTGNVTNMSSMFYNCKALTELELSTFNTANVTSMASMFSGCGGLTTLDLSLLNTENVTNMSSMFYNCKALTELKVSNFDTANVTNMSSMFWGCSSLEKLELSNFDTTNVTTMASMFLGCSSLKELELSNFDTTNVTKMSSMFTECSGLTEINLSTFTTDNVTTMQYMFQDCTALRNVTGFVVDTSQTAADVNMGSMFLNCRALTSLDVSDWDTSNVTKMDSMFDMGNLTNSTNINKTLTELELSGWDTSRVTTMGNMFQNCRALTTLELSGWNTAKVTDMEQMFGGCRSLEVLNLSGWSTINVTKMTNMFYEVGCDTYCGTALTLSEDFCPPTTDTSLFQSYHSNGTIWVSMDGSVVCKTNDDLERITQPITLVPGFCVTLDANGGIFGDESTETTKKIYLPVGRLDFVTSEVPAKDGVVFNGWDVTKNDTSTRLTAVGNAWRTDTEYGIWATQPPTNLTLYAEWTNESASLDTNTTSLLRLTTVGDAIPNKTTFHFTITPVEANTPFIDKPNVTQTVDESGTVTVDFGMLNFTAPGVYHFNIAETDNFTDGWVCGYGTKTATVTVTEQNGELIIASVRPVTFTNHYTAAKDTDVLTENDKSNESQYNEQTALDNDNMLLKSARWTDKDAGQAEIQLVYTSPDFVADRTTAVYLLCNCTAHGFNDDIATENIKTLLQWYDQVDVICGENIQGSNSITRKTATFLKDIDLEDASGNIHQYINSITWSVDQHLGALCFLTYLQDYLDGHAPDAIYLSFDGSRGFSCDDGPSQNVDILKKAFGMSVTAIEATQWPLPGNVSDKTLAKLAAYQDAGNYYCMTAEADNSFDYANAYPGKNEKYSAKYTYFMLMTVNPAWAYRNKEECRKGILDVVEKDKSVASIDWSSHMPEVFGNHKKTYSYKEKFDSIPFIRTTGRMASITDVVDSRWNFSLSDVRVTLADGTSKFCEVKVQKQTGNGGIETGTKVMVDISTLPQEQPVVITIPVTTKETYNNGSDWFDNTNIGDAFVAVTTTKATIISEEISGNPESKTEITVKTPSPMLYSDEKPEVSYKLTYVVFGDDAYGIPDDSITPETKTGILVNTSVVLAPHPTTTWTTHNGKEDGIKGTWVFYPNNKNESEEGWNYNETDSDAVPLRGKAVEEINMPEHNVTVYGKWVFEEQQVSNLYSLKLTKENVEGTHLYGAGFAVYKDQDCTQLASVYSDSECTQPITDDSTYTTSEEGLLYFYGLEPGTYYIKEVKTNAGYTLLRKPIQIEIRGDGTVWAQNLNDSEQTGLSNITNQVENYEIPITVVNTSFIGDVPKMGGGGILIYLFIGFMLLLVPCGYILLMEHKRCHKT